MRPPRIPLIILAKLAGGAPSGVVRFGGYFLWAFGIVVGLAALYGIAYATKQLLWLPVGIGIALLLAVLRFYSKLVQMPLAWGRDQVKHLIDYPRLATSVSELSKKSGELQSMVNRLETTVASSYRAGVREGNAQFIGAALCSTVTIMPSLVGIAKTGESVQLQCHRNGSEPIPLSTRFTLVATGSAQPVGVLVVTSLSNDGQTLTLDVVDEILPAFWNHQKERAAYEFTPPQGVTIERYPPPSQPEEQQNVTKQITQPDPGG